MVTLDQGGGVVANRDALDDVGVERSLGQEVGVTDALERSLEDFDKGVADDLALGLRLRDALQPPQKQLGGVHHPDIDVEMPLVKRLDHLALASTQESVVHEHAGQLLADRPVNEGGRDRGVDATG